MIHFARFGTVVLRYSLSSAITCGALQYLTTVMGHHMAAHGGSLGTPVYYLQKMVYTYNNIEYYRPGVVGVME